METNSVRTTITILSDSGPSNEKKKNKKQTRFMLNMRIQVE